MLAVKNIKVMEVEDNPAIIYRYDTNIPVENYEIPTREDISFTRETIHGEKFTTQSGQKICIGMTKEVQEAIGIPFEAFRDMNKAIDDQRKSLSASYETNKKYSNRLFAFQNMPFLGRLKCLFFGYLKED